MRLIVTTLAFCLALAPGASKRVPTTGKWTVVIPKDFQLIDNQDSWQAHKGDRVVYVSSLAVKDPGGAYAPAPAICASAAKQLGKGGGERLSFSGKRLQGAAAVTRAEQRWQLKGVMCADGAVATCLIHFVDPDDKAWAVSTWKSLEHP